MKLYIYDHCPFCVKARMIFGLKNIPVELNVLQNDDEATPTRMIGQKMVPILQKDVTLISYCCRDLQNPLSMNFLPLRRASILSAKKKPHLAVLTTILRTLPD